MRYSILGFNQERVRNYVVVVKSVVRGKKTDVELRLDVVDLLLLNHISDFPNRTGVKKVIKDGDVYFWVYYNKILEDLPVLGIKKQALIDRFDKMVKMHILRKEFVDVDSKNKQATFFSLTNLYESLLYENQETPCSQLHTPPVVNYTPHNNNIITNNINKEIEDKSSIEKDWRTDKSEYVKLIDEAVGELLMDENYKKQQEEVYVNIDYKRTIIACGNYWKDDEQWKTYKRKKIKTPNFISTIKKGFKLGRVYKPRFQQNEAPSPTTEMTLKEKFESFLVWLRTRRGERAMYAYRITIDDFREMLRAYPNSAEFCNGILRITEQPLRPNEKLVDAFRRYHTKQQ